MTGGTVSEVQVPVVRETSRYCMTSQGLTVPKKGLSEPTGICTAVLNTVLGLAVLNTVLGLEYYSCTIGLLHVRLI